MEHIKEQRLHCNLSERDVLFYYTSCSWMMWNWLTSGLASGATLLIFDGAPYYPNPISTWKLIDDHKVTIYGTSAKYINASLKMDLDVYESLDLPSLKVILSTGSPLYEDDFDYIYQKVKKDVQLSSISGGTDIVGCFTLGNPMVPVVRGQCQCISLGYPVKAYNEAGNSVLGQEGELVCEKAVPSMPITLWGDHQYEQYKKSYFAKYPQVWNHSDYILITEQGGVKILGRSDATLNRAGIRIGTAEIYRLIESLDTIQDSLVIHIDKSDRMVLFLQTRPGLEVDEDLKGQLKRLIKKELSPRHCPDEMLQVSAIPYTKNGKKVELAVKRIFTGEEKHISLSSLDEPNVLNEYRQLKSNNLKFS
jgi:acetoacetyl-CoA synthetase